MDASSPADRLETEREFESEGWTAPRKDCGDGSANGSKWGLARWSDARLNLVGPPDPVAARSPHPTSSPPRLLLPGLGWCYPRSSRDSFLIHSPLLLSSSLLFILSSSSRIFSTQFPLLLFNFGAYSCARRADLLTRTAAEGHLHY